MNSFLASIYLKSFCFTFIFESSFPQNSLNSRLVVLAFNTLKMWAHCSISVEISAVILSLFLCTWLFFITGFRQFDYNMPQCAFLCGSCAQGSVSFLIPRCTIFIKYGKVLAIFFFRYFLLPPYPFSFRDSSYTYCGPFRIIPQLTDPLGLEVFLGGVRSVILFLCMFHFGQFLLLQLQIH